MRRYLLVPPSIEQLACAARWLRGLDDGRVRVGFGRRADDAIAPTQRVREHAARVALTPKWRTRDKLTEAERPAHDDLKAWQGIGASHALLMCLPTFQIEDARPCAQAYTAAYAAVFGAYLQMDKDTNITIDVPAGGIAPLLAAALVRAACAATPLERDGNNKRTGYYSTADGVAAQSRALLNAEGLTWMCTGSRLQPPTLATCTIGTGQHYVGDVVTTWLLIHESGATVPGSSSAPVVAMPATPHDKAVGAALTYLMGHTLRGLLCLVREDKHATEQRLDREASEPETCAPTIVAEVVDLISWMAAARSKSTSREVRGRDVFAAAWKGVALPADDTATPANMNPGEGDLVLHWLRATKAKLERFEASVQDERQPGEDDPRDVEPPPGWEGHDAEGAGNS